MDYTIAKDRNMAEAINIVGCVADLLNIQCELIEETIGVNRFNILKNIPVEIGEEFTILEDWEVKLFDSKEMQNGLPINSGYILGVVGTSSKKAVFQAFKEKFDVQAEQYVNLVHPSSYLARSVEAQSGLMIEQHCIIAAKTQLGFGVNIKRGCNIGHHCAIGDFVTINPGVTISGLVSIGKETIIGTGTAIRDNISIGENVVIGMGSVVTKDIPDNVVAFGNPCKVVRAKDKIR